MTDELKKLLSKALPLSLAGLFTVTSDFIIIALLSKSSENDLAAYVTVSSASGLCINPLIALTSQLPVFISENYARIKSDTDPVNRTSSFREIENNLKSAWYFGITLSIIPIAILANMESISKLFVSDNVIREKIGAYFLPYVFSIPLQIFNSANLSFLSSIDEEKHIYWLSILQIIADIGLAFWLIPLYGIAGSGYIKLASSLLITSAFIVITLLSKNIKQYSLLKLNCRSGLSYTRKYIKAFTSQGLAPCLYMFSLYGSSFITTIFINKLGKTELIIFQSILQYLNPLYAGCRGISEAGNRYTAQMLGIKDYSSLKTYGYLTLIIAPGLLLLSYAIGVAIAPQFVGLFSNSSESVNDSQIRLTFMAFAISKTLNLLEDTCGRLLAGIEDTYLLATVNILTTFALTLPLQATNAYLLEWDVYGIAAGAAIGYLTSAILLIKFFSKQVKNAISDAAYDTELDTSNAKISKFFRTTIFKNCKLSCISHQTGGGYERFEDSTSLQMG